MLEDATTAFNQMFSRPFRGVLFKTVGLTLLLFLAVLAAGSQVFVHFGGDLAGWLFATAGIFLVLAWLAAFAFLFPPVTAAVASLFLDEIAEIVERVDYPDDPPGKAMPTGEAIVQGIRFVGVVILVNIGVLLLILLPGINTLAFFLANGYLLGREYFELAAGRFRPRAKVKALRKANGGSIFVAGLLIALFVAIPVLNLMTPLFATAFMVHTHKRLSREAATLPA